MGPNTHKSAPVYQQISVRDSFFGIPIKHEAFIASGVPPAGSTFKTCEEAENAFRKTHKQVQEIDGQWVGNGDLLQSCNTARALDLFDAKSPYRILM